MNILILAGLVTAASGMGLMFVGLTPLQTICNTPYGSYNCEPYVPPEDPCYELAYCTATTTTTTHTTVIVTETSTNTLTKTVTNVIATFETSTVLDFTTSTITETSTVAKFSTTTITVNGQLSTVTHTVSDDETGGFAVPFRELGLTMMLGGSATMIIGVRKKSAA